MARILVVDDDDRLRTVIRAALELAGHEVIESSNGEAGLRAFRRQPSDLVLCDLFMPAKEGLEKVRELCRGFPHAKVVGMSAGQGAPNRTPSGYLGAGRFLRKPFGPNTLLKVVNEVLEEVGHETTSTA
jgi:DNA-binding response OmpR family regulator